MKNRIHSQESEVDRGERFSFGENWQNFLGVLDEQRIQTSINALQKSLNIETLENCTFLDVGSGSGLSSLAAYRLGAKVTSFDFDPASVMCTKELRSRYATEESPAWNVLTGSVLDREFLETLGTFDIVYSWGVLHHTGNMWSAFENLDAVLGNNARLVLAIYNDQGGQSRRWKVLKQVYNKLPAVLKKPYTALVMGPREVRSLLIHSLRGNPGRYFDNIANYSTHSERGMNYWYDLVDWIGGYPFEVAAPDEVFSFFHQRGMTLKHLNTAGGELGCNEFVFERQD